MAEEPQTFMLSLLGEICGKLDDHDGQFSDVKLEIRGLRMQVVDWQETTATSVGFATHGTIRTSALEHETGELRHRIGKFEETH